MKTVLQKYIASSGYCSRRKAEELIRAGKVIVDGERAELGQYIYASEEVKIGKITIKPETKKIYIKLNKPRGYTCTSRQFDAEQNVFELVDKKYRHLHIVGRLDKNSHGLVILTNDGNFTERMTHPRYKHEKEYLVRIKEDDFDVQRIIKNFKRGVDIGNGDGVVKTKLVEQIGEKVFKIILTQGKKDKSDECSRQWITKYLI